MNLQQLKSKIADAQDDGKNTAFAVGSGCYAQVRGQHVSWLFKYRFAGKARAMGLGSFDDIGMADAIKDAKNAATLVRSGKDPRAVKSDASAAAAAAEAASVTLNHAVARYVAPVTEADPEAGGALMGYTSRKHAQQWRATLDSLKDGLGKMAVSKIETVDVAKALRPAWLKTRPTAMRLRARIEAVLDYSTVNKWRSGANPATLDLVGKLLSKDAAPEVKHHPALPWQRVPECMANLRAVDTIAARCLELTILCAARRSEIQGLRWDEFDAGRATITIPRARLKVKKHEKHVIPLSKRALEILKDLPRTDALVFPGEKEGRCINSSTTERLLYTLDNGRAYLDEKGDRVVLHGFRSSFSDWAAETGQHHAAKEACLDHRPRGIVGVYERTTHMDRRKVIMELWADYCERGAADNVQGIREVA